MSSEATTRQPGLFVAVQIVFAGALVRGAQALSGLASFTVPIDPVNFSLQFCRT